MNKMCLAKHFKRWIKSITNIFGEKKSLDLVRGVNITRRYVIKRFGKSLLTKANKFVHPLFL